MWLFRCSPLSSSPAEGSFQASVMQEPPSPAEWWRAEGGMEHVWERLRRNICQQPLTKGGGGVCARCYSQTICKQGCWSQAKDWGTAGAPLWLIKVAPRTSSRCEWRQKPDNVQRVCNVAVIKWQLWTCPDPLMGEWDAMREVRTHTNYHFMTNTLL